jgi:hypothetical protein
MTVTTKKILAKVKVPLAIAYLFALAWGLAELITLVQVDVTATPIALAVGITLGIGAEIGFDLEILFVGGGIVLMLACFLLMVSVPLLSAAWFKLIFMSVSLAVAGSASAITMQWLIKNWICKSSGKLAGVCISALAIGSGIILCKLY